MNAEVAGSAHCGGTHGFVRAGMTQQVSRLLLLAYRYLVTVDNTELTDD